MIAALKAGARIVEPEGITMILEPLNILVNHPRQLVVHSADAADVLRAVGSPNVKMLFDIYHQQISEGNLTGNIRKYRDLIGYFQLADHPGRHEPTTGEINYPYVLRTIHDIGYRDPIGMEMSPAVRPDGGVRGHPPGRRRGPLLEADGLTDGGSTPDAMADVLPTVSGLWTRDLQSTSARSDDWLEERPEAVILGLGVAAPPDRLPAESGDVAG